MAGIAAVPARDRHREAGFTLVEVVVASAVLLVVLIPLSAALLTQTGVVVNKQAEVAAAHLASSQLEADRAVADQVSWSGSPPAPALPLLATPVTLPVTGSTSGTISYTVSRSTGWCMASATGTGWTSTTTGSTVPSGRAVAFKELVTVTWNGGEVQDAQLLEVPAKVVEGSGYPPTSVPGCPS